MLTQIKRIKSLGVFDNYTATADQPAFGRYNVVYGENGSGKTTLSRLIACLEAGEHPDHPDLEYSLDSQSGTLTHGKKYARRVRVFNSDYIDANIGRFEGPLRHILILGEENKAIVEDLKAEIATRDGRETRLQAIGSEITKLESDRGKLFPQIAKTIGEATSGSTLRSYRKPDAEAAFSKLGDVKALTEVELEVHRTTVRQEQLPEIGQLKLPVVGNDAPISIIEAAAESAGRASALIKRSAQAAVVERLAANPAIATWVEQGVLLHNGAAHCEFCAQPLPAERLRALADHFSVEDQSLKEELDKERSRVAVIIEMLDSMPLPDRLAFYSELRTDFDAAVHAFAAERVKMRSQLEAIREALTKKLTLRTTPYETELQSEATALRAALGAVASVLKRHNRKTTSFEKAKATARSAIEAHYMLTIRQQVNDFDRQSKTFTDEADLLRNGGQGLPDKRSLEALNTSINAKQAQISSAHAGGEGLTNHLKQFLGRTDLRVESGVEGYIVLRRGKPARRLSEGEKTAIAFLYFLVQLKDQDFDLSEGVVVIDDPISSLDASAIYQAFSFLKNETQAAKQLFILTHNFEFLRLLINWMKNVPKTDRTFSMVLCAETENGRSARLAPLDKLLIEHATEYHYLFKVLYTFKSDGTILGCYHVPNIARKVLETFLDFLVPSSKNLYLKLDEIQFDAHKKTAIYKFANDLSHHTGKSFDPALVAEAQKNTRYLLDMIKEVAPLHFQGLEKLSQA